ncbi:MAG TPA: hypothetical protein VGK63_07645 [Candidatus Limnocylindrales bacterium]
MTDDMTRRSGDAERLEDAAREGPVTEGLDMSDPAAGDPERLRALPEEDLDAEARTGRPTGTAGGTTASLAGGAGVSTDATNPETRGVAGDREVVDDDGAAMPTEPAGGTH